jgi:MinD-like ATPase involved in chromosome partitioning or flagellar assembly
MTLVAVTSMKGAPGATTTALALAAAWPREALLAEADPAGSDLLYRLRDEDRQPLPTDEGVLAYLADEDEESVLEHAARTAVGVPLLTGPPPARAGEMAGAWQTLADRLSGFEDLDVVADCGRLTSAMPALPLLRAADAIVLVTRPTIDGVAHLLARVTELVDRIPEPPFLEIVVVTDTADTRSPKGIASLVDRADLPVEVLGRLALDPEGVQLLGAGRTGRLEKSLFLRSARELARKLDDAVRELVGS